jgi:holin-like protein
MLTSLTLLLLLQLLGEVIAQSLHLPVPGPVIGMALLFAILLKRGGPSEELRSTSQGLLSHLSLLFVPAGTGVILYVDRMADEWLPLTVSLVLSTALCIIVSALVLSRLAPKTPAPAKESGR